MRNFEELGFKVGPSFSLAGKFITYLQLQLESEV